MKLIFSMLISLFLAAWAEAAAASSEVLPLETEGDEEGSDEETTSRKTTILLRGGFGRVSELFTISIPIGLLSNPFVEDSVVGKIGCRNWGGHERDEEGAYVISDCSSDDLHKMLYLCQYQGQPWKNVRDLLGDSHEMARFTMVCSRLGFIRLADQIQDYCAASDFYPVGNPFSEVSWNAPLPMLRAEVEIRFSEEERKATMFINNIPLARASYTESPLEILRRDQLQGSCQCFLGKYRASGWAPLNQEGDVEGPHVQLFVLLRGWVFRHCVATLDPRGKIFCYDEEAPQDGRWRVVFVASLARAGRRPQEI